MAALDNDGSSAMQREVAGSTRRSLSPAQISTVYQIAQTAEMLRSGGYKQIALQFPDELLVDSTGVSQLLQAELSADTQRRVFILADTSFGSCCVDEVAAEHYSADIVVHYGRTCLSLTSRVPVFYVFGRDPVDVDDLVGRCTAFVGRRVLVMFDVMYEHCAEEIGCCLRASGVRDVVVSSIAVSGRLYRPAAEDCQGKKLTCEKPSGCCGSGCNSTTRADNIAGHSANDEDQISAGRSWTPSDDTLTIGDYVILYIGGESHTLTNIMMTQRSQSIFSYDPSQRLLSEQTALGNRHLSRRYVAVQKARDADVIGIVVGTLAATRYIHVVEQLKQMVRRAHKKLYLFVVGKLSMNKLANFAEIEAFVLVACPENSLVDSKEFDRPVVTPYEMMLALSRSREWSGNYITDFREFLDAAEKFRPEGVLEEEDDSDVPHFSLVTGTLKQRRKYDAPKGASLRDGSGALAVRNDKTEVAKYLGSAAAEHLLTRQFQGLGHDQNNDEDVGVAEPALAVEGRSGIARGYVTGSSSSDQKI
ncbi:Diphthamide biosynthesis protein 2 [Coemansia asiatica]|uniref:2-(3-amino-3-carboxypropyl)histidine synthase subunit 2 n=1 Tax=Coemansia asiatica TaxID=1052880 RepID=A0A9W7XKI0_9FUNG|nr:Diphthamide biosynthesis protein 2 [Coemansia asiatica]